MATCHRNDDNMAAGGHKTIAHNDLVTMVSMSNEVAGIQFESNKIASLPPLFRHHRSTPSPSPSTHENIDDLPI